MKTHVLTGSKNEIVESVGRIDGVIREVIVFVEEPIDALAEPSEEDIFAEMLPYMVDANVVDDSREAIYTRLDGE